MDFERIIPIELMQRAIVAESGGFQARAITPTRPKWDDMIKNYPNTSKISKDLYSDIGGNFPKFNTNEELLRSYLANSCAIRMSRGLILSGFKLPASNIGYGSKGGILKGGDGNYWLRVKELSKYLSSHLGTPEFDKTFNIVEKDKSKKDLQLDNIEWQSVKNKKNKLSTQDWNDIKNLKGIVVFDVSGWGDATGHFTLWNGSHLIYPGGTQHDDSTKDEYYFNMLYQSYYTNSIGRDIWYVVQTNRIRIWELK